MPRCAGAGCRDCGDVGYRGRRAIAEILVASPEFERRVAAGAPPESIAEAARANGCVPLWESGLALVRRGETSIDELRRVAAEPARQVMEPRRRCRAPPTAPTRIGWWSARTGAVSGAVRAQLLAAAAALGGDVEIVQLGARIRRRRRNPCGGSAQPEASTPSSRSARSRSRAARIARRSGRRYAERVRRSSSHWRPRAPTGEHLRLLGHDANVVLPATTHGRVVLATVLALLRWRGG